MASEPRIFEQPAEQYHADHARLSKSMLWDFIQRRRIYEAKYVLHNAPPEEPTKVMDIGTLADAALLEPHRVGSMYRIYPEGVLGKGGRLGTNAANDFEAECASEGVIPVKQVTFDTITAMVESAKRKLGSWLDMPSQRQPTVHWTNELTGMDCRCRPDWLLLPKSDVAVVFDLKTTADCSPGAFKWRCKDNGYGYQHVHYSDGIREATARKVRFLFFVVETKWPFECAIHELTPETIEAAEHSRLRHMEQINACRESGDYSEPWANSVSPIDLPNSCFHIAG